ncbi:PP2C family protein-serine/threonine phosphatase [Spirillospora sp. NPDC048819]|uniref:PP2C family protein-serine/threonine phosphatase n=1 Tax=Spirillospora sp. NPDC048819 TaxID=3155268 RepID=UPI0033D67789
MAESAGRDGAVDRSEGFGERLLGQLLDRAHEMPPQLIAPLVAEEVRGIGGRDVAILLQDYSQLTLVSLPGWGLTSREPMPLEGSPAGEAFLSESVIEHRQDGGVQMFLPLLDGSDQIGVMSLTLDNVDDDDRRLLRRLAGLVAELIVTKDRFTDQFFQARRREAMTVSAEIQWSLLPPLTMTTPQVAVAGILEPAYDIAGDSMDYALNDDILHMAMVDAMGHGLNAAVLATVAIGAYRHARRADSGLAELYAFMDKAIDEQFGPDHFTTAQMMRLNVTTGDLRWVNAGHHAPLLIRGDRVHTTLEGHGTLPVGIGATPQINTRQLRPGDRVLAYTDGLIEEHTPGGEQFGVERLIDVIERVAPTCGTVQHMVRRLSHTLKRERGEITTDDASIFLVEWRGDTTEHLAVPLP